MSVPIAPARPLRTSGAAVVLAGLAASAVALATAPALMPPGYSWVPAQPAGTRAPALRSVLDVGDLRL
jgi:hypothetical protein